MEENKENKYLKPLGCKDESGIVAVFKGIAILIWTIGIIAGIVIAIGLSETYNSFGYGASGGGQAIISMLIIWISTGVAGLMPYALAIIISSLQTIQNQGYEFTDQKPENAAFVPVKAETAAGSAHTGPQQNAIQQADKADTEVQKNSCQVDELIQSDSDLSIKYCPVCGKALSRNAKFCTGCGAAQI